MVNIQNNSGQYRITLPKDLARLKNWKKGTEVILVQDSSGSVIIKEIK